MKNNNLFNLSRPRRNRKNQGIRNLVRESLFLPNKFVMPIFVHDGDEKKIPIASMPDYYRLNQSQVLHEIAEMSQLGIKSIILFPSISDQLKSEDAKESFNPEGLIPVLIKEIKSKFPEINIFTDIALDPYSTQGHDGLVNNKTGEILNDATIEVLCKMALTQAEAGADVLGPSDMMDGRIGSIRLTLDECNFTQTSIMSYCAKYASAFYGPFREALDSAPKSGDKKTYQMDYNNRKEALRELALDEAEGADLILIKPALAYLDIIHQSKQQTNLPVGAYNVSGEYSMIKYLSLNNGGDYQSLVLECINSIHRSGADFIISYFAKDYARIFQENV